LVFLLSFNFNGTMSAISAIFFDRVLGF